MAHRQACLVVEDESDCPRDAVATIVFVDRTGLKADVPACSKHKAEHNQRAAALRNTTKR